MALFLIVTHFVADWVLQSNWMALNKSKNWEALLAHVLTYSFVFWLVLCAMGYQDGFLYGFTIITFATHFVTDAVTSRITSKLWFIDLEPTMRSSGAIRDYNRQFPFDARVFFNKRYWFFAVIGLDQLIHYVTLAWTWRYFGGM